MENTFRIVATLPDLEEVAAELEKEKKIAVDLEADSMFHFKEKVCLVQLAYKNHTVVIDPLEIQDFSVLKPIFKNKNVKKIFHGADYDVRSLYRDFKIEIDNLFDCQLASMFLGIKETGLGAVLKDRFNIRVNKKYQRKDWSKRPLPEEMLNYAAQDVLYLIALSEILEKELSEMGRLEWVKEECGYLSKVRPAENNSRPLFFNFKGAGRLDVHSLTILEALLQYRRKIAQKKDKPLFKIISNAALMRCALKQPSSLKDMEKKQLLSQKQIRMFGEDIIHEIEKANDLPERELPVCNAKKAPVLNASVPKRIKAIKIWRDRKAAELKIDPGLMFNKALINAVASRNPRRSMDLDTIDGMKNWQKKTFGKDMIGILKRKP